MKGIENEKTEKGKVLGIEEDINWTLVLKRYLEFAGFYVEVVDNVENAIGKIKKEMFHFITIDMQLNKKTWDRDKYEGWSVLEIIKKLRTQYVTPTMVITAFDDDYNELKHSKKLESIFFMGKAVFDRDVFIEIIEKSVAKIDLHFYNDHRGQ